MRILWYSDGMHINSGFGKVTRYVCRFLAQQGFDIMCFNRQLFGGNIVIMGVPNVGTMGTGSEEYLIPQYFEVFERDTLITLMDIWYMKWIRKVIKYPKVKRWIPYVPVHCELKHELRPEVEPLYHCYKAIAMSKFGYEQLKKVLPPEDVVYIPHGVDTNIYKPLPEEKRKEVRKILGISDDDFVFGFCGVNLGDRKGIPELIKAFSIFLENNPDAKKDCKLLLWTNITYREGSTFDILLLLDIYKVRDYTKVPRFQPPQLFYDELFMRDFYNAIDVYVTNSRAEGFGLPLLEAQACGKPCIAPNNTAQRELVEGHGWLVKEVTKLVLLTSPTHGEFSIPDVYDMVDKMVEAYNKDSLREHYAKKSLEFARQYDWNIILHKYWLPFMRKVEEETS